MGRDRDGSLSISEKSDQPDKYREISNSEGETKLHGHKRKSRKRHRRSGSSSDEESESGTELELEYSSSESGSESVSDSESEEERRRRRRRRREKEKEREERERRRRKEKKKRRREREEERGREKKKREKKRREKEKRKREKKERGKKGAVTDSWGKYGIIRETDIWNKRPEFTAWLAEVKQINLETLPNWEEKQLFKEFMEDHNTATFPSKKYFNLDAYYRRQMEKEQKKGTKKVWETERTVFNDEEQRRLELMREREKQKEEQVETLKRSMQGGMAQAMKEQALLREEMALQYKLGNYEAAAAIQRKLDPDVAMKKKLLEWCKRNKEMVHAILDLKKKFDDYKALLRHMSADTLGPK